LISPARPAISISQTSRQEALELRGADERRRLEHLLQGGAFLFRRREHC
jgi:hypothetical protein